MNPREIQWGLAVPASEEDADLSESYRVFVAEHDGECLFIITEGGHRLWGHAEMEIAG